MTRTYRLDEREIQEALALWVQIHHGVDARTLTASIHHSEGDRPGDPGEFYGEVDERDVKPENRP